MSCLFCEIIAGRVPSRKVYEDDQVIAILDIYPATIGHILVLSKKHYPSFVEIDEDLAGHLGLVSKRLAFIQISNLKADGVTMLVQEGIVAGQRAPHFVLHLIPRKADDRLAMTTQGKDISRDELEQGLTEIQKGAKDSAAEDKEPSSTNDTLAEQEKDDDHKNEENEEEEHEDNENEEQDDNNILDVIGELI